MKKELPDSPLFEIIDGLVDEIARKENPLAVVVSGSVARGDYGNRSDVDLYILVNGDGEKTFKVKKIGGRRFEFSYYPVETLKKEIIERIDNPRELNVFYEARVLYDPMGVADECIKLARRRYEAFRYPPDKVEWARYAVTCMKDKIMDDLDRGDELFLVNDVLSVVNYVTLGLLYMLNIPHRDYRGNLEMVLNNTDIEEGLKRLIVESMTVSTTENMVKASLELCDMFLAHI